MRFAGSGQINDFLLRKENFQNIGQQGREERARQMANAFENEALIASTGLKAQATVAAAEHMAEATRAQGAAQGQASLFSGLAGGIGKIAGGLNFGASPSAGSGWTGSGVQTTGLDFSSAFSDGGYSYWG